jgi:hypothetical protein
MVKDRAKLKRRDKQNARSDSKKIASYSRVLKTDVSKDRYRAAAGRLSEIQALTKTLDPKIVDLSRLQDERRKQLEVLGQARSMNRATNMGKKADKKVLKAQLKNFKYQQKSERQKQKRQKQKSPVTIDEAQGGLTWDQ